MTEEERKRLEEAKKLPQEPGPGDGPKDDPDYDEVDAPPKSKQEPGDDHNRPADKDTKKDPKYEGKETDDDEDEIEEGSDKDDEDEDDIEEGKKSKKEADDDDDDLDESMISRIMSSISESFVFESDQSELGALLESEEFSDEFKDKAITVFESAVTETASKHLDSILESAETEIRKELEERYKQIDEEVESYLDHAVKDWMNENKLAIESSVRLENTESFMSGLKELLESHYVEVPEDKEDLLAASISENEHLEEAVSEQIEKNVSLEKELAEAKKQLVFEQYTKDMTDVDAERLKSLVEGTSFESEDQFKGALNVLEENFISHKSGDKTGSEPHDQLVEEEEADTKLNESKDNDDDPVSKLAAWMRQNG